MRLSRGDIVLTDLEPSSGSEQGKTRPTLVIQNDKGNRYSPTTIVAAMTNSYQKVYPTDVEVDTSDGKTSKAMLNQIFTVDTEEKVKHKLDSIDKKEMKQVNRAIQISLGLE